MSEPIFRSLKPFPAFSSLFKLRARLFSFYMNTHNGYSAAADVDAAIALTCAILRALTPDVLRLLNPMA